MLEPGVRTAPVLVIRSVEGRTFVEFIVSRELGKRVPIELSVRIERAPSELTTSRVERPTEV